MRLIISQGARRDLKQLSRDVAQRVAAAIDRLAANPRPPGCLLLHDYHPRTWRIRVGDRRVLYEIDDHAGVVTVTGVRHRSKAY
jgi:mRNA interferase RelE/StbE